jgi:hypothetical protein
MGGGALLYRDREVWQRELAGALGPPALPALSPGLTVRLCPSGPEPAWRTWRAALLQSPLLASLLRAAAPACCPAAEEPTILLAPEFSPEECGALRQLLTTGEAPAGQSGLLADLQLPLSREPRRLATELPGRQDVAGGLVDCSVQKEECPSSVGTEAQETGEDGSGGEAAARSPGLSPGGPGVGEVVYGLRQTHLDLWQEGTVQVSSLHAYLCSIQFRKFQCLDPSH